jgi:hypothetical protein
MYAISQKKKKAYVCHSDVVSVNDNVVDLSKMTIHILSYCRVMIYILLSLYYISDVNFVSYNLLF